MSSFMDVGGLFVIWMLWPRTDARSIVEAESASLRLLWLDLQPFPSLETLYPLVIHVLA